jgi:hypothetical protein
VAQCQGVTKKGERCKREAMEGHAFCVIHQDQEIRPRTPRPESSEKGATGEWDQDAILKAALGVAVVALVFLLRFRR